MRDESTFRVKTGLAEMLKGGVIMDVVTPEQAKVAEDAGAAAVMALERVPADIRRDGGVARMSDPEMISGIQEAVSIPVMAKARIGHFMEARVLEALEVDYIDESEVLTPADEANHIDKWDFKVPFVCGATNLGEALRRIGEGAAMIRSKGEAGTGDIVEAVRHMRQINGEIRRLGTLGDDELPTAAKNLQAPLDIVRAVAREGRLPVVLFCAGGIATPADAALMMALGAEGVFVGSGIFKSEDPPGRARARGRGDHALAGPRAGRRGLARSRAGDGQSRELEARGRPAARPAWLVALKSSRAMNPLIGVLALQGGFEAHERMLHGPGPKPPRCAYRGDLEGLDGLVIPGGESTTMTLGVEREGLTEPLRAFASSGRPVLGSCAGLIMLDRDHLGVMDMRAARNAFGRQIHSFEAEIELEGIAGGPLVGIFIRAPWIAEHGEDVRITGRVEGRAVAAVQGPVTAVAFHAELGTDDRLHRFFEQVERSLAEAGTGVDAAGRTRKSRSASPSVSSATSRDEGRRPS